MSFKAVLVIDDQRVPVVKFSYNFNQGADVTGRPSQMPLFKGITIMVKTQKEINFVEWMIARDLTKQLTIEIIPNILTSRTRRIKLYDAHLVDWDQNFSATNDQPLSEILTITAGGFEDSHSSGIHTASWRVTFPDEGSGEVTAIAGGDLIFVSAHFEDEKGNKIDEKYNGKATLVLKTENGEGKIIDLDLSSDEHNYKYNGDVLEDDILTNLYLLGDLMKIELEIIEE